MMVSDLSGKGNFFFIMCGVWVHRYEAFRLGLLGMGSSRVDGGNGGREWRGRRHDTLI